MLKNATLFHAKTGGDLEGENFHDSPTFFAPHPDIASTYAEHRAFTDLLNDGMHTAETVDEALPSTGITVFPVLLTLDNPATTERALLFQIGQELGIAQNALDRFADNFEDSVAHERDAVFHWLQQAGFDGAILPKDLMPVTVDGDWQYKTSYVSFYPGRQVRFKLAASCDKQEVQLGEDWMAGDDVDEENCLRIAG